MAVRGGYIHHSTEGEERTSSGGLSKAFCSTDEGISCLDLGGINYLFMGDVFVWAACRERDKVWDVTVLLGIRYMFDLINHAGKAYLGGMQTFIFRVYMFLIKTHVA